MILRKCYILLLLTCVAGITFAQKTDRDYLRSGNKLYKDSLFIKSISIKKEYINNHPKTRADKRFRHNKERAFENNK